MSAFNQSYFGSGAKEYKLGENKRTYPSGPEAQNLVRNEVLSHFRERKVADRSITVPCPWHISDDGRSKTLSINLVQHLDGKGRDIPVGFCRCWSCGTGGDWNKLADHIGMQRLEETDNPDLKSNVYHIEYENEEGYQAPDPDDFEDLDADWDWVRKDGVIKYKTLISVGARIHNNTYRNATELIKEKRLWLPAHEFGDTVGHINAAAFGTSDLKYVNSKGGWATSHFFGFDEAVKLSNKWAKRGYKKFVVVVEGPADCLMLLQHNIPAVACLGTQSWSTVKANLLIGSFDIVFAMGDGDDPGRKLNQAIKKDLKDSIRVHKLKLNDGQDPASLKKRDFKNLIDALQEHAI